MSTYQLPGKGIPAVLRRAAGMAHPGGSPKAKAKAIRSLYDGMSSPELRPPHPASKRPANPEKS